MNVRSEALQSEDETATFGYTTSRLRWGWRCTALRISRKVAVTCWRSGEGFRKVDLDNGGSWWKIAGGGIFGQKEGKVFVVGGWCCGGDEG